MDKDEPPELVPAIARKPAYFVVFSASAPENASPHANTKHAFAGKSTLPHRMDRDLIPVLKALWFCLQLPASCFDFMNLAANLIQRFKSFDIPHEIMLVPDTLFATVAGQYASTIRKPVLVIADELAIAKIRQEGDAASLDVEYLNFRELNEVNVKRLWPAIAGHMGMTIDEGVSNRCYDRLDTSSLVIPLQRILRQLKYWDDFPLPERDGWEAALEFCIDMHVHISLYAEMETNNLPPTQIEAFFEKHYRRHWTSIHFQVSVAMPGVPSSFCREMYPPHSPSKLHVPHRARLSEISLNQLEPGISDFQAERTALQFLTTHRANAVGGLGITLPAVSSELFGKVNQLEEHLRKNGEKPEYVWKLLEEIGRGLAEPLSHLEHGMLARATHLTAFTNFPIGWMILPPDTSPLMCRVPISYRPLLPLTRTIQFELRNDPKITLSRTLPILIVECVAKGDHIRDDSIRAWRHIAKEFDGNGPAKLVLEEASNPEELRRLVRDFKPAILILSAHGHYDRKRRVAGILIGEHLCIGPELGPMPPFVILSACHAAPRGTGAVNVAELVLREGAMAVLAAQVPVRVDHNALLVSRFLSYLIDSAAGNEPHENLAAAWHRTSSLNAIMDITFASLDIARWSHTRTLGKIPLEHFMRHQANGHLRAGHVYADSERLLLSQDNIPYYVSDAVRNRRYLPETLFYALFGCPDRIMLIP